jgi:DNA-directed RNA polymerase subunit RPC12/RpoP
MSLISLRCPKCDGEIQLDEAKEYGFCMYCGNKVVLKETIQKFKLELDNLESLDRLVKNADTFVKFGDYAKAAEFYQKVVNCFPENYQGWLGLFRIKVLCSKNTNDIKRSFNFLERALITADDSTKKGKIKEKEFVRFQSAWFGKLI